MYKTVGKIFTKMKKESLEMTGSESASRPASHHDQCQFQCADSEKDTSLVLRITGRRLLSRVTSEKSHRSVLPRHKSNAHLIRRDARSFPQFHRPVRSRMHLKLQN